MPLYYEYAPDSRLQNLVETYWVSKGYIDTPVTQRIMPDGCVDIIFDFEENCITRPRSQGQPDIVGTMSSYFDISYSPGHTYKLGIRFNPAGITAFTRVPVHEFTNLSTDLMLTDTLFDNAFHEQMPELESTEARLAHINRYLLSRLPHTYQPEQRIVHAIDLITGSKGQFSIGRLSEEVCLCQRQFERRFKDAVGISAKVFSRVIRFRYTQQYMKQHPNESVYSAALSCGYHDDSHLAKEFRQLGGVVPKSIHG